MTKFLVSPNKTMPWWQAAPRVVFDWCYQVYLTLRASKQADSNLAIDLALAKVRRRQALVNLVRARQEVFIGLVGGVHRLSGRGRLRKMQAEKDQL